MDIKELIKSSIGSPTIYNDKDFVAVQFLKNNEQQYYIVINRWGQRDIILDWKNTEAFISESKNINITNINQLDEELKKSVLKRIEQIYLNMLEIK